MVDFASILNKKVADVEKPRPRPTGIYRLAVVGMPKQKTINTKDGDRAVVSFVCKAVMPLENVDMDELALHGDLNTWPPFNHDFWVDSPEGEWAMRQFVENSLQVEIGDDSWGETLAKTPGINFAGELKHRPYQDKSGQPQIATEIGSTAAL